MITQKPQTDLLNLEEYYYYSNVVIAIAIAQRV